MRITVRWIIAAAVIFSPPAAMAGEGVLFHDAMTSIDSVKVEKIIEVHDLSDIVQALDEARAKGLKISIAGQRHAQGGQQSISAGILLDMYGFNRVISLDVKHKIIRVQAGATWSRVQNVAQRFGLAASVLPNRDFISVGGSLGSNIHGDDPNYGSIIGTVKSFHLMTADGRLINVSRQENPELFRLVIGGYGLFGVITDADIALTDNVVYRRDVIKIPYQQYPQFMRSHALNNPQIGAAYGFFLGPTDSRFLKMIVYTKCSNNSGVLKRSKKDKKVIYMRRISRTRSVDTPYNPQMQKILQEYCVPTGKFVYFINRLRSICLHAFQRQRIFVYLFKTRFIKADRESFLPYTKVDSFGISVDIRIKSSEFPKKLKDVQDMNRRIIALVLRCGGRFYLTKLAIHPDKDQLVKAYPEFKDFVKKKKQYDPQEIFMNQLYSDYAEKK